MTAKIYALAQQKGGVGKTTTAINLGAALVARGRKVLLVDVDPQGALSAGLGIDPLALKLTLYNVLRGELDAAGVVASTETGCDLLPANIDLSASEIELVSEPGRERILKEKLSTIADRYDFILIDCPPSLSLLTLNALSASSGVIIPVQTQYFALRGLDLLFKTIEKVQARINPGLKIVAILPTMHDARTLHAREIIEELRTKYGSLVCNTAIPLTVKLPDSVMAGQSIFKFSPGSPAAEAYRQLAEEVERRG